MQLCYSENAVNYFKKNTELFWGGGAASHIDLGAEGDVRPQLQYNNIIHVGPISFQMA